MNATLFQFFASATSAVVVRRTAEVSRTGSRELLAGALDSQIPRRSAGFPLTFALVSSADHRTPVTGATPTVLLSKAGGAFAAPAGAVTEIGSGWYAVAGNATDTAVPGPLILHATASGADPVDLRYDVVRRLGVAAIAQSTPTYPLPFLLISAADHLTGLAGALPAVTLSKAGGAFAAPSGAVSELGNGWYVVAANATDVNTAGPLILHATAPGSDPCDVRFEVAGDPVLGATTFPLVFAMVLASDHRSAATGLAPTVTLSKAGGAFAAPAGAVSEIGSGWYKVAASATDLNTAGPLILHATAATADPADVLYEVVGAALLPPVRQATTTHPLVFLMVKASDHITPATGLTPTVTLSQGGGAFATPAGAVTEIGGGWYAVAGNATDTGAVGPLLLHATAPTADPTDAWFGVAGVPLAASGRYGNPITPNVLVNVVDTYKLTVPSMDADGAQQNTFTPLAYNVRCQVRLRDPVRELTQLAVREVVPVEVLFAANPGLSVGDRIDWTDDAGGLRQIFVTGVQSIGGRGAAWLALGEEVRSNA